MAYMDTLPSGAQREDQLIVGHAPGVEHVPLSASHPGSGFSEQTCGST